jgi:hypothetical protein
LPHGPIHSEQEFLTTDSSTSCCRLCRPSVLFSVQSRFYFASQSDPVQNTPAMDPASRCHELGSSRPLESPREEMGSFERGSQRSGAKPRVWARHAFLLRARSAVVEPASPPATVGTVPPRSDGTDHDLAEPGQPYQLITLKSRFSQLSPGAEVTTRPLPRSVFAAEPAVTGHPLQSHDVTGNCYPRWLPLSDPPNMAGGLRESRLALSGEPSDLAAVALGVRQGGIHLDIEPLRKRRDVAGPEQGTVRAVILRQAFGERNCKLFTHI